MSMPPVPTSLRSWMSAVTEIARAVNAAEPLEEVLNRVAAQARRTSWTVAGACRRRGGVLTHAAIPGPDRCLV